MKKQKWIYLMLIVLSAAVFVGYRFLDGIRTDDKAPEISFSGALSISVQEPREALLQGVTAKDNRDGNVTDSLVVESISMTDKDSPVKVVYAAFDAAGNVAKAEREVTYTDYASPRFSLTGPLVYSSGVTFNVLDWIDAADVIDGDISRSIRATSLSETSIGNIGVHDVQFRVTNSLGDSVEVVLPVEVYSSDSYKASLSLTDYLVYLPVGSSFNARDYLYQFSYTQLEEPIYLRGRFPEELSLSISGQVDTTTPGVYAVSYTVTGELREVPYAAYSKLIVIVEG